MGGGSTTPRRRSSLSTQRDDTLPRSLGNSDRLPLWRRGLAGAKPPSHYLPQSENKTQRRTSRREHGVAAASEEGNVDARRATVGGEPYAGRACVLLYHRFRLMTAASYAATAYAAHGVGISASASRVAAYWRALNAAPAYLDTQRALARLAWRGLPSWRQWRASLRASAASHGGAARHSTRLARRDSSARACQA